MVTPFTSNRFEYLFQVHAYPFPMPKGKSMIQITFFYFTASCILLATVSSASTSCLTNSEPGNDFTDVEVEIQNDKNIVLKDSVHKNELNHMLRESSANSDKV